MQRSFSGKVLRHENAKSKYRDLERKKVENNQIQQKKIQRIPKPGEFFVLSSRKEQQPAYNENHQRPKSIQRTHSAISLKRGLQFKTNQDPMCSEDVCAVTKNINIITNNKTNAVPSYRVIPDLINQFNKNKRVESSKQNPRERPISGHILKKIQQENIKSIYESQYLTNVLDFDVRLSSNADKKLPSFIVKPKKRIIPQARGYNTIVLKSEDIQQELRDYTKSTYKEVSNRRRASLNINKMKNNSCIKLINEKEISPSFLSIEYYILDDLTPSQLLSKYRVQNKVEGFSKWFFINGDSEWKMCEILRYDVEEQRWLVRWQHNNTQKFVSRSNLMFKEENEDQFLMMMERAENYRNQSQVFLKYNFIIDLMKTSTSSIPEQFKKVMLYFVKGYSFKIYKARDPLLFSKLSFQAQFKQSFCQKILNLVDVFSKKYQQQISQNSLTQLVFQVSNQYVRANHQIQFDSILPFSEQYQVIFRQHLPPKMFQSVIELPSPQTNRKGCISICQNSKRMSYQKTTMKIRQMSHLSNVIRLKTLSNLRRSQLQLQKHSFCFDIHKPSTLEQLSTNWEGCINDLSLLIQCRSSDSQHDIGSELDLMYLDRCAENENEYQKLVSQVTKFLWIVNHRYQIAIKNLYINSLQSVYRTLDKSLGELKQIDITFDDVNKLQKQKDFMPFQRNKLLIQVSFKLQKQQLVITPQMKDCKRLFEDKKQLIFKISTEIPCIQKSYLPRPRQGKFMKIFEDDEEVLVELNQNYNNSLQKVMKCFELFQVKISEIVRKVYNYANVQSKKVLKKKTYAQFHTQLKILQSYLSEIEEVLLPRKMQISIFLFDCKQMRQMLIAKIYEISVQIYKYLIERIKKENEKTSRTIQIIIEKLQTEPTNIQSMVQLAKYAQYEVNIQLQGIYTRINEVMGKMDLLAEMNYKIDYSSFQKSWQIYSVPLNVKNKQARCLKLIQTHYKKVFGQQLVFQKERIFAEIKQIQQQFQEYLKYNSVKDIDIAASKFMEMNERIYKATQQTHSINSREELFNLNNTDFESLENIKDRSKCYYMVWVFGKNYALNINNLILLGPLHTIDKKAVSKQVNDACEQLQKLQTINFKDNPKMLEVTQYIRNKYNDFQKYLPLIHSLRNQDLRERHISAINDLLNIHLTEAMTETLSSVINAGGFDHQEQINELSMTASQELVLEKSFNKLKREWRQVKFKLSSLEGNSEIKTICELDEMQYRLDNDTIKIQNMLSSPYCSYFEQEIIGWRSQTICKIQEVLELLTKAQNISLTLHSFFSTNESNQDLSRQTSKYQSFDKMWNALLNHMSSQPSVVQLIQTKMKQNLVFMTEILEQIRKGLSEFFNSKREQFRRFSFVSNEDLLNIYSKCASPTNIKESVNKCFDNIDDLQITQNGVIQSIQSQGVQWKLQKQIQLNKQEMPEKWFKQLQMGITDQLKSELQRNLINPIDYSTQLQILLLSEHIIWTNNLNEVITTGNKKTLIQHQLTNQFNQNKVQPQILQKQICVMQLRNYLKDVTATILKQCTNSTNQFYWQIQLRHTINQSGCFIHMMNISKPYGYQFFGNKQRLYICPPTIRALTFLYLTLEEASFGCLTGKQYSGKSSTITELSRMIGRKMVYLDCRATIQMDTILKVFQGCISSGNWLKIQRIEELQNRHQIVSVLCQYLQQLKPLMLSKKPSHTIIGDKPIKVDSNSAVFLTALDIKYTHIAESLRSMFRSTSIVHPNTTQFLKWTFLVNGFKKYEQITQKIVTAIQQKLVLLSRFKHYDFSFSMIKELSIYIINTRNRYPQSDELEIVFLGFQLFIKSKLHSCDELVYMVVIDETFPDEFESKAQSNIDKKQQLQNTLLELYNSQGMSLTEELKQKLVSLSQLTQIYKGVIVLGDSNTGKTTGIKILSQALKNSGRQVAVSTLFPKSLTQSEFFGKNSCNQVVIQGYYSKFLKCLDPTKENWVVFDAKVGKNWSSNLSHHLKSTGQNSISSLQKQQYPINTKLIFQTPCLSDSCPQIVVSCAKVFFSHKIHWTTYLNVWLKQLPLQLKEPQYTELFATLFNRIITPLMDFYSGCDSNKSKQSLLGGNQHFVLRTVMKIFDSLIMKPKQMAKQVTESNKQIEIFNQYLVEITQSQLIVSLTYSLIWGMGSLLEGQFKNEFCKKLKQILSEQMKSYFNQISDANLPNDEDDLFSIYLEDFKWKKWNCEPPIVNNIVPTPRLVCQSKVFKKLSLQQSSLILIGKMNTGRTSSMKYFTSSLDESYCVTKTSFYQNSSLSDIASTLQSNIQKQFKRKGVVGPPAGKINLVLIDDLHLPIKNSFGQKPAIQILRSWFCEKGWVDRKTNEFKKIQNIAFYATCSSMKDLQIERIMNNTAVFKSYEHSQQEIQKIFSQVLFYSNLNINQQMPLLLESISKITLLLNFNLKQKYQGVHNKVSLRCLINCLMSLTKISQDLKKVSDIRSYLLQKWVSIMNTLYSGQLEDLNIDLQSFISPLLKQHYDIEYSWLNISKSVLFKQTNSSKIQEVSLSSYMSEVKEIHQSKKLNFPQSIISPCFVYNINKLSNIVHNQGHHCLVETTSFLDINDILEVAPLSESVNIIQINYVEQWVEQLKRILKLCSVKPTYVCIDAYKMGEDVMFDLNCFLHLGTFLTLFSPEEKEHLLLDCNIIEGWEILMQKIKANLKIIIHINCQSDQYQQTSKKISILSYQLQKISFKNSGKIIEMLSDAPSASPLLKSIHSIHNLSQQMFGKSLSAFQFEKFKSTTFSTFFDKNSELSMRRKQYQRSILRIQQAKLQKQQLSTLFVDNEKLLDSRKAEVQSLNLKLQQEVANSEKLAKQMEDARKNYILKLSTKQSIQKQYNLKLQPFVAEFVQSKLALKQLQNRQIKNSSISKIALQMLIVIFDKKSKEEDPVKALASIVSEPRFLKRIDSVDENSISVKIHQKLKQIFVKNAKDLSHQERENITCRSIIRFAKSVYQYLSVVKQQEELKCKLDQIVKIYQETNNLKQNVQKNYSQSLMLIKQLKIKISDIEEDCSRRSKLVYQISTKMTNLQLIHKGYAVQISNWKYQINIINETLLTLEGDVLIFCATAIYLSQFSFTQRKPFIEKYRSHLLQQSINTSSQSTIHQNLPSFLSSPVLPGDMIQNICLWKLLDTHCLFLDSEGLVQSLFKSKADNKNFLFLDKLQIEEVLKEEQDVQYIVTVQNSSTINASLQSYMMKNKLPKLVIICQDHTLPLSLTIQKKKLSIINFAPTQKSLKDKFIQIVINMEQPLTQQQMKKSEIEKTESKKQIQKIYKQSVHLINSASTWNQFLSTQSRTDTLLSSLTTLEQLRNKLRQSKHLQERFAKNMNVYEDISNLCLCLYNSFKTFEKVQKNYGVGLEKFLTILKISVREAQKPLQKSFKQRILLIQSSLKKITFKILHSSVKRQHRLGILLFYILNINKLDGLLDDRLFELLLTKSDTISAKIGTQISPRLQTEISKLSQMKGFTNLNVQSKIKQSPQEWIKYFNKLSPQLEDPPECHNASKIFISALFKLLKPEEWVVSAQRLILSIFDVDCYRKIPLTFFVKNLHPLSPLICVSSTETSGVSYIKQSAHQLNMSVIDQWMVNINQERLLHLMKDPKWLIIYSKGNPKELSAFQTLVYKYRKNTVKMYSTQFRVFLIIDDFAGIPFSLQSKSFIYFFDSTKTQKQCIQNCFVATHCTKIQRKYYESADCSQNQKKGLMLLSCIIGVVNHRNNILQKELFSSFDIGLIFRLYKQLFGRRDIDQDSSIEVFIKIIKDLYESKLGTDVFKHFIERQLILALPFGNNTIKSLNLQIPNSKQIQSYQSTVQWMSKIQQNISLASISKQKIEDSRVSELNNIYEVYSKIKNTESNKLKKIISVSQLVQRIPQHINIKSMNEFQTKFHVDHFSKVISLFGLCQSLCVNTCLSQILDSLASIQSNQNGQSYYSTKLKHDQDLVTNNRVPKSWTTLNSIFEVSLDELLRRIQIKIQVLMQLTESGRNFNLIFDPMTYTCPQIYLVCWRYLYMMKSKNPNNIKIRATIIEDLDKDFTKEVGSCDDIDRLNNLYVKNLVLRNGTWSDAKKCIKPSVGKYYKIPFLRFTMTENQETEQINNNTIDINVMKNNQIIFGIKLPCENKVQLILEQCRIQTHC